MLPKKLSEDEFREKVKAMAAAKSYDLNSDRCAPARVPNGMSNRMYVFVFLDINNDDIYLVRCRDCISSEHIFNDTTMHIGICQDEIEDEVIDNLWTIYGVWEHLYLPE